MVPVVVWDTRIAAGLVLTVYRVLVQTGNATAINIASFSVIAALMSQP
jgi:hypothetical protein